jgi:hypothetical protein
MAASARAALIAPSPWGSGGPCPPACWGISTSTGKRLSWDRARRPSASCSMPASGASHCASRPASPVSTSPPSAAGRARTPGSARRFRRPRSRPGGGARGTPAPARKSPGTRSAPCVRRGSSSAPRRASSASGAAAAGPAAAGRAGGPGRRAIAAVAAGRGSGPTAARAWCAGPAACERGATNPAPRGPPRGRVQERIRAWDATKRSKTQRKTGVGGRFVRHFLTRCAAFTIGASRGPATPSQPGGAAGPNKTGDDLGIIRGW